MESDLSVSHKGDGCRGLSVLVSNNDESGASERDPRELVYRLHINVDSALCVVKHRVHDDSNFTLSSYCQTLCVPIQTARCKTIDQDNGREPRLARPPFASN